MNVYYAKSILYAYSNLHSIMEQIDELVLKKALSSMTDFSPCEWQCNKILSFTAQKDVLIELKLVTDSVLSKLSKEQTDILEYKYFKTKPKEYFEFVDTKSRGYFRKQIRLINRVAEMFERRGVTDRWFEEKCLAIDFFKELLKRVIEHESLCRKNKSLKEKTLIKQQKKFNANAVERIKTTA